MPTVVSHRFRPTARWLSVSKKKSTKDGHPYFNLKAANHQIIGSSESYSSDGACDKGIASVKVNGSTKTIKDKTLPVL